MTERFMFCFFFAVFNACVRLSAWRTSTTPSAPSSSRPGESLTTGCWRLWSFTDPRCTSSHGSTSPARYVCTCTCMIGPFLFFPFPRQTTLCFVRRPELLCRLDLEATTPWCAYIEELSAPPPHAAFLIQPLDMDNRVYLSFFHGSKEKKTIWWCGLVCRYSSSWVD